MGLFVGGFKLEVLFVQLCCVVFLACYLIFLCGSRFLWSVGVFVYSSSIVLSVFYFLCDSFTGKGVTEAVFFHVIYGFDGVVLKDFSLYFFLVVFFFLVFFLSVFIFWRVFRRYEGRGGYRIAEFTALAGLGFFSVVLHPAALQAAQIASDLVASAEVSLSDELADFDQGGNRGGGKNLVYIYVESFERTFLKEEVFPGLAPNLSQLEKDSLYVEGIGQAPLTDWTIAGMVASQCGMPLATFKFDRNDISGVGGFMPGTTCFGDVIKERGYYSVFMGGADLSFAGKGAFYRDHGFDEVIGRDELVALNHEALPFSKWGVYDDVLLEAAYSKYKALVDAGRPFAMFLLTLDTHPPIGHRTPSCRGEIYEDGRSGILNAVRCSDRLVSDFVKKIESYSSDNLVVVVASDHLQMRNDISDYLVAHQSQRENLFLARGAGITPGRVARQSTTLDIFPTLLSLMEWENVDGAALGRNLLGHNETLVERYGRDSFYSSLQKWRMALWGVWSGSGSGVESD